MVAWITGRKRSGGVLGRGCRYGAYSSQEITVFQNQILYKQKRLALERTSNSGERKFLDGMGESKVKVTDFRGNGGTGRFGQDKHCFKK